MRYFGHTTSVALENKQLYIRIGCFMFFAGELPCYLGSKMYRKWMVELSFSRP